jgi:chromosome partitioning protein
MTPPVVSFFNNKGGVGKTTLVYHLAWMAAEMGVNVLAADLDPQANLTAACLDADIVEHLWDGKRQTIYGAISPLLDGVGDLETVDLQTVAPRLSLLPGDLRLASAEQEFSQQWPICLDGNARAFRVISAPARAIRVAAESVGADIVLLDVGPSLGAINRVAMASSDFVVVPLSPDLYSIQGLRNLGPTLRSWRAEWAERKPKNQTPDLWLPPGAMQPAGYVVLQHGVRVDRAVGAYDRWIRRVPAEYRVSVLDDATPGPTRAEDDPHCLGLVKHYHSLVPMAQEARKPLFKLRSADGAIGAHQRAVAAAFTFFQDLTGQMLDRVGVARP